LIFIKKGNNTRIVNSDLIRSNREHVVYIVNVYNIYMSFI